MQCNRDCRPDGSRQPALVVMTTGAMHMAMRNFFFGCLADINHFYIEIKLYTGQAVVGIDHNAVVLDLGYRDNYRCAVRSLGVKLRTDSQVSRVVEHFLGHFLYARRVFFTVAIFGRNLDAHFFACGFTGEGVFQAGNNIPGTMQIKETAIIRLVNNIAVIVFERVMQGYNRVWSDLHGFCLSI